MEGGHTFSLLIMVKVVVECDATVAESDIEVDWIDRGPETTVYLRVDCPSKQKYYK